MLPYDQYDVRKSRTKGVVHEVAGGGGGSRGSLKDKKTLLGPRSVAEVVPDTTNSPIASSYFAGGQIYVYTMALVLTYEQYVGCPEGK